MNYSIVEKPDCEYYGIKIGEGCYKDVVFFIGQVRFKEKEDENHCELSFDYQIDEVPIPFSIEELKADKDFSNLVGDIIVELLDEQTKKTDTQ
jgi:hypothetical protein